MSAYIKIIREAVVRHGRSDRADDDTAAWIEDLMRINRTGLDHLTRQDFEREALECLAALETPEGMQLIRDNSDTFGLRVPSWARTQHERCGEPLHKACTCVRVPGHHGPCNCTFRNGAPA